MHAVALIETSLPSLLAAMKLISDCRMRACSFHAGCLEAGYEDYQQIREDPDLEGVRGDSRFQSLISKYAKSNGNGFFGNMLKGFKL